MIWKIKNIILSLLKRTGTESKKTVTTADSDTGAGKGDETSSNKKVVIRQGKLMALFLLAGIAGLFLTINLIETRQVQKKGPKENPKLKIQVAGDGISSERKWTTHLEDEIRSLELKTEERLKKMENSFSEKEEKIKQAYEDEIKKMDQKLAIAREELGGAKLSIGRVLKEQEEGRSKGPDHRKLHEPAGMSLMNLADETEYDRPKSNRLYIPETTYVRGYLLSGLAVSTAMGTPDRNAPPVVIRLTDRGNLSKNFAHDVRNCRILGSAYGDLSSERAFVRAEKMVCDDPVTNLITTSTVAGDVRSGGMNGIKGEVVATSSKHIKNAMVGGVISGLASSAKGRDGGVITPAGAVSTKGKNFGAVAGEGVFNGTSTAAEKIADYYLRQAEAMSPVLIIEPAVEVEVLFIKGFYFGEISTHKKIKDLRNNAIAETSTPKQAPGAAAKQDEEIDYGF